MARENKIVLSDEKGKSLIIDKGKAAFEKTSIEKKRNTKK